MSPLTPPMRPYGVHQVHQAKLRRSGAKNVPYVVVEDVRGLPVSIATRFLYMQRKLAPSRLLKMGWVMANTLDWLKARRIDPGALMLTGDGLFDHHVLDLIEALQFVGPRTAAIRVAGRNKHTVLHVGDVEWMNRVDIAKRFLIFWMERVLNELRRTPALHAHVRNVIQDIKEQFEMEMISATSDPRKGLEPAELAFFEEIIHPAHPGNPWGDDKQMMFVIGVLYRLVGHRAREILLYQVTDVVRREGRRALRLLPTDLRYDDSGLPVALKQSPRYLRIPDWAADLLQNLIDHHRPLIGERLKANGNLQAYEKFRKCPYIFVSSWGSRLSATTLYDRLRLLRSTFPDKLPADFSPARLRNSRADEVVAASREGGFDLSRVAQSLFGWFPGSVMLERYANMDAERMVDQFLRKRANMVEGIAATISRASNEALLTASRIEDEA